ncbi:MAG: DUF624 domain-containing protein [Chloroflexi bacterium]|nr:MAG: DUF624 domain-containing protein [Chloroflexota bacterium]
MAEAWRVVRLALRNVWGDLLTTVVCNLLWVIFSLLIITGPPATLALFHVANRIAHGELTNPTDFLRAVRRYFGVGWRWGVVNSVMLFLLVGDVVLTGRLSQSAFGHLAQGFFVAGLAAWLLLQLYVLPLLFEQETPGVRLALRNAAVMLAANPFFSALLLVLLAGALLAGTLIFFVSFAIGGMFVALVGNHAVLNRLTAYRSGEGGA